MPMHDQTLESNFGIILDELAEAAAAGSSASELSGLLSRLAEAAEFSGMANAAKGCAQAGEILAMSEAESGTGPQRDYSALPMLLMDYLAMPDEEGVYAALLDYLFTPSLADGEAAHDPFAEDSEETRANAALPFSSRVNADYLAILVEELGKLLPELGQSLAGSANIDGSAGQLRSVIEQYAQEMALLGNAASAINFVSFQQLVSLLGKWLNDDLAGEIDAAQRFALAELPQRMLDYLQNPQQLERADAILSLLTNDIWPSGLNDDTRVQWAAALSSVELFAEIAETRSRPHEASADAVSLQIPEDINLELLDGLLQELPVQTSNFTASIQSIAAGKGNRDYLELAKRAAHTLKGAANTVGIRGIANLTHHLEDILIALSEHQLLPGLALSESLVRAADCLEAMSDTLTAGEEAPTDALAVLQEVLNWANRIDEEGIDQAAGGSLPEASPEEGGAETRTSKSRPMAAAAGGLLRVPTQQLDEILRLVGETITTSAQAQNRLKAVTRQIQALSEQNALLQQLAGELETLVDVRGIATAAHASAEKEGFDALEFEQYGELHTLTRRLIELAADSREMGIAAETQLGELGDLIDDQGRLHQQSQDAVMRTRMVPVKSIASRLQRGVRQACRLLDKNVELGIDGEETLIDGNVLHSMIDPLMHLLRNAVDHGIESSECRVAVGKPAIGRISLGFSREGDSIVLRCKDDGAGLDLAAIRASAERKGLIDPNKPLDDEQISRLVLLPGFSTSSGLTQVSGRGIGMDAVYSHVLDLKGTLYLHSEAGRGLTVEIRLPNSLLSVHALLVRVQNQIIALSARGIEDVHYVEPGRIETIGGAPTYRVGDRFLPVMGLSALLAMEGDRKGEDRSACAMLVVRLDTGELRAIVVQEVLEMRHLVVKKLGRWVPRIGGVIGAAVLGDGSVSPVLDLTDLLRAPSEISLRAGTSSSEHKVTGTVGRSGDLPVALVVDDSLTARRSTAMAMREAGFDVHTAIDGMEAVAMLDKLSPDIVVTDMEMPRMNGLELSGHIRSRSSTREVPVIMITSRSTEKHRRLAQNAGVNVYLTKPFENEELLGHIANLTKFAV